MAQLTPEEIGQKAAQVRDDVLSGKVSWQAMAGDPLGLVAGYGLVIPDANKEDLKTYLTRIAQEQLALPADAAPGSTPGCIACDIGLGIALAALVTLLIAAVAGAVVALAPEVAIPVAIAFLSSQVAFPIVEGVIIAGSTGLAVFLCHKLIKC